MRIWLAVVALVVTGCEPPTVVVVVTRDGPAIDAGGDADADSGEPDDPCRCAFHWARAPETIVCYTRGACDVSATCVPTLPLSEEPSCHFE